MNSKIYLKLKRVLAAVTAAALTMTTVSITGFAETTEKQLVSQYVSDIPLYLSDNTELEKLYIEQLFYGENISLYKDYGRNLLTDAALEVYELIRAEIENIADGKSSTTSFDITMTESFVDEEALDQGIEMAVQALMLDLPHAFYWYDKVEGYVYWSDPETQKITDVLFSVSDNYFPANGNTETVEFSDGSNRTYNIEIDSSKMDSAKIAVKNAQAIAAKYDGKSDYEKIVGYCEEICGLVSYNDAAADDDSMPYGDPWQLVWVFDGDENTNVVCEGYSKAFQYLCDLGGIECYTVMGNMSTDTVSGPHMWNLAVLENESYHVDVTNCDKGKIGAPDKLLLKGADGVTNWGYGFPELNGLYYKYDENILYPDDILLVSVYDYEPSAVTMTFDDTKELVLEVIEISDPDDNSVSKTAQLDIETYPTGISKGMTYGYLKNITITLSGINFKNFSVEGLTANDVDVEIYAQWGDENTLSSGVSPWDLSTVNDIYDDDVLQHLGYRLIIKGNNSIINDMETGSTITINAAEKCEHDWTLKSDETGHWEECSICGEKSDAVKHTEASAGNGKEADCTENGREADTICSECGYIIKAGSVIPAKGHTPDDTVKENLIDPTCTKEGTYDEVVYCTVCNEEISRTVKTIDKLPHDYVNGICSVCGEKDPSVTEPSETEPPVTEPSQSEPIVTKPSETEPPVTEPSQSESIVTKPSETEPPVTEPSQSEPIVTKPSETEPPVTEPSQSEPIVTEPSETEPPVTEPSQSEPIVTDPPKTEPVVTRPPVTAPTETSRNTISAISDYPVVIPVGYTEPDRIIDIINSTADGDTAVINLKGSTNVEKDAVDAIAERGITAEINLNGGAYWTINANDIENSKNVDLGVRLHKNAVPKDKVGELAGDLQTAQFTLRHNGEFGFTGYLHIPVGKKYDGQFANLYYYNKGSFEYICSSQVSNSMAVFALNHASDYVIVIDAVSHGEDVSSASGAADSSSPAETAASVRDRTSMPDALDIKKLKLSCKKRRYRIVRKRKLDDLVFVF